jgi:transketolase
LRNAFAKLLVEFAQRDDRIVLLSGDIGNRLFDNFKATCPARFFNCGVAEANMLGVAAGMAMSGLRPVCYTIAPFITYRCFEQIRLDICYHGAPVVIVGGGAGLAYASLGPTHHSCEDLGTLRLLPGLAVVAPADAWELGGALTAALQYPDPVYIRIGKKGEPVVHTAEPDFVIGKAIVVRDGADVCLLSTGTIMPVVLEAAELLAASNISAQVVSFHTIKPLDDQLLSAVSSEFSVIATIEEHSVLGGLGGSVAEWMADHPTGAARLVRLGTADEFLHETCTQQEARDHFQLTSHAIADRVRKSLLESVRDNARWD